MCSGLLVPVFFLKMEQQHFAPLVCNQWNPDYCHYGKLWKYALLSNFLKDWARNCACFRYVIFLIVHQSSFFKILNFFDHLRFYFSKGEKRVWNLWWANWILREHTFPLILKNTVATSYLLYLGVSETRDLFTRKPANYTKLIFHSEMTQSGEGCACCGQKAVAISAVQ